MDFSHLQTFCTVIEAGSISKAARELYVTQPAVSMKIQELEEHYRVKLLERSNKGVVPTEVGLYLYREGQRVLSLMGNISREIEQSRNPEEEISIGASDTLGNYALPCTLFVFKERRPYCNIVLNISNSAQVVEWLSDRKIEIGLIEGPVTEPFKNIFAQGKINARRIARSELVLVAPNEAPYQEIEKVSLKEFMQLPLILREPGSGIRANLEQALAARGLALSDLHSTVELHSINAIVSAVSSGKGVSLLPKMAIRKELRYKVLKPLQVEEMIFYHDITLLYYTNSKKQAYTAFTELLISRERGFC